MGENIQHHGWNFRFRTAKCHPNSGWFWAENGSFQPNPTRGDQLSIEQGNIPGPIFFSEPFQCLKAPPFPTVFFSQYAKFHQYVFVFSHVLPNHIIATGTHTLHKTISIRPERIHQSIHQYNLVYTWYDHVIYIPSFGSLASPQQLGACAVAVPQDAEDWHHHVGHTCLVYWFCLPPWLSLNKRTVCKYKCTYSTWRVIQNKKNRYDKNSGPFQMTKGWILPKNVSNSTYS